MTQFIKYYQFAILTAKLQQVALEWAKDYAQRPEIKRVCELASRKSESNRQDLMLKLRSDSYRNMQHDYSSEEANAILNVVIELMECFDIPAVEDELINTIKKLNQVAV